MRSLDPRAQLAVFAALLLATLFGGRAGLAGGAVAAAIWIAAARPRSVRGVAAVLPLALAVALFDALAGRPTDGVLAALRLVAATGLAIAFAATVDARALTAGLRALRVPFAVVFVLVAGARFVPVAAADLADLTDAARLRGLTITGSFRRRIADWSVLLVPLLVLTIRRGLQLGEAMEARGFSRGTRSASLVELRWRMRDTIAIGLALLALATIVAAGTRGLFQ